MKLRVIRYGGKHRKSRQPKRTTQNEPQKQEKKPRDWLVVLITVIIAATGIVHVCIYRSAVHKDYRAYIVVLELRPYSYSILDCDSIVGGASVVNIGRTPAYDVSGYAIITTDKTDFGTRRGSGHWFIGPNETFAIPDSILFAPAKSDVKLILSGELPLYFYVYVSYRDIFNDVHTTIACQRYTPTGDDLFATWITTENHNYSD